MGRFIFSIGAAVAALGLCAPAHAEILVFDSELSPEVGGATGTGYGSATFDTVARTLAIKTSWSGLSGTTTVAHIHCCVNPPGTVGVAVTPSTFPGFPTGLTAGFYAITLDLTQAGTYTGDFVNNFGGGNIPGAEAALLQGFQQGRAYLNIHTTAFRGGEIRGFLTAVPEPATWAMMIGGFGLVGAAARRRGRNAPANA